MSPVSAYILDTASKVIPLIVSISGRVGSDSPIICEQSGLRGVIVEQIVRIMFSLLVCNYSGITNILRYQLFGTYRTLLVSLRPASAPHFLKK